MKKITYLLTIIILLMSTTKVLANTNNNIVDFSKKGTITITLINDDTNLVEGANIKIYKLADAYSNNNNLDFSYNSNLEECKNNIKDNNFNEETLNCIYNSNLITKEAITDNQGYTSFNNLDLGLYFIEQTNKVDGYSKIDPFLIYMPKFEDNKWTYEINATPKVDIIRLFDLTVKKEWNVSSDSDTPNEVTVELLKDEVLIETVTLSKENNWEYTWEQIEVSDEYNVREINVPEGYTPTYKKIENTFIITNSKTLVQTGQMTWITSLLVITGLLFIIIGIVYDKKETNA